MWFILTFFFLVRESLRGVIANVLDCDQEESEFKFQSLYYIYFQTNAFGKGMDPYPILLQVWFWYEITLEGLFAIKQRKKSNTYFVIWEGLGLVQNLIEHSAEGINGYHSRNAKFF